MKQLIKIDKIGNRFRLAFVQLVTPSYKLPMFEGIRSLQGVDLTLFVGDKPTPMQPPNADLRNVPNVGVKNRIVGFWGLSFVCQSLRKLLNPSEYDLVILPEGILYFSNYMVMLRCWWKKVPFGIYTHGYNYQRKKSRISYVLEKVRGFIHRRCSVLIVYSEEGAKHLARNNGVLPDRIFIARNTLNVETIIKRVSTFTSKDIMCCRTDLGASPDDVVLVYVGRIDSMKNPGWVVETFIRLRQKGLPVRAIFIGDGKILSSLVEKINRLSAEIREAIRVIGQIAVEKVDLYLLAADITVMPGMTGLAIVHSFAIGRPYITIKSTYHSPEVAYLKHGVNGLMADANMEAFCDAVESLVINSEARKKMGISAFNYAKEELTMANQIKGFEQAIKYISGQR
jgi:glycosyltransferase involved in cell wall biosynthesis